MFIRIRPNISWKLWTTAEVIHSKMYAVNLGVCTVVISLPINEVRHTDTELCNRYTRHPGIGPDVGSGIMGWTDFI